ncbi:MAG TPA: extracellular solute-binding protein [Roseiarcus sp.]|jgi:molybdate/tungstate transport system substrate-binding protein
MHRRAFLLSAAALPLLRASAWAQSGNAVNVLYAGSLVNLMERGIGPAFNKTGDGVFQGFAQGSNALANQIKGRLRHGDVFISATPNVNNELMGEANGNWVSWYATFAQSPLVIGYNPSSRFADALKTKPWYEVMQEPGIRIGRTDPKLDPKGRLTIELFDKASLLYNLPDLTRTVLGEAENPAQVSPEETLVGRLQSGQLDVGFFYATETSELKIPAIALPPETALAAHYTVTVLNNAANAAGAARFVSFLLGPQGAHILHQHGLELVKRSVTGDASQAPASLRSVIEEAK